MFVVCCECKKMMGTKAPLEDKRVSHTICNTCLAKTDIGRIVLKEMEKGEKVASKKC